MTTSNVAYMVNNHTITIYTNGRDNRIISVNRDHRDADTIIKYLMQGSYPTAIRLADIATSIKRFAKGAIKIEDGQLFHNGDVVHNALASRIVNMWREGQDFEPMVKFLENLHSNPSKRAVDELYGFLEANNLPITKEGEFLAYKNVNHNYRDRYTNTFDNRIGKVCKMERNKVDDNKDRTCSSGLHFCSMEYLKGFWGTSGHTMIVAINPRDVVSIPVDYNNSKGRCCRYKVVAEHVLAESKVEAFSKSVYDVADEWQSGYDVGFDDGVQSEQDYY